MINFLNPKLIIVFLISFCFVFSASAAVPHLINYQGKLTDSEGVPLNGTHNVTFRIYDSQAGGNLLWTEAHTQAAGAPVTITNGIFSIILGSLTNLTLPFDQPYWLSIQVGGDPEMSPRQQIASVGYAIRAEHGVPHGVIVMWSGKIVDIPSGWALCDGANGTPDLRDRFIVGARQDDGGVAKTNVTGILTQSGDGQIPAHDHGVGGAHTHTIRNAWGGEVYPGASITANDNPDGNWFSIISTDGAHAHASVGTGTKNIAVYYALAYIMKL